MYISQLYQHIKFLQDALCTDYPHIEKIMKMFQKQNHTLQFYRNHRYALHTSHKNGTAPFYWKIWERSETFNITETKIKSKRNLPHQSWQSEELVANDNLIAAPNWQNPTLPVPWEGTFWTCISIQKLTLTRLTNPKNASERIKIVWEEKSQKQTVLYI